MTVENVGELPPQYHRSIKEFYEDRIESSA